METEYRSFMMVYCRTRGVIPSAFASELLLQTVYPHTRPLVGLLAQLNPDHFRADHEFIEDVSCLQHHADFGNAAESYVTHPANAGFFRRRLRLRISVRRMLQVVNAVFPQEVSGKLRERLQRKNTLTPFAGEPPASPDLKTQSSEETKPVTD